MGNGNDWYRNETWNSEIAEQFQARLQRSRKKSQYLRIQANILAPTCPNIALTLLEQYFETGDDFDLAQAYVDQATAYLALDDIEAALTALEAALARESEFPNVRTQAYLLLPRLVAARRLRQHYVRALDILDAHRSLPTFPVEHHTWHGARALILSEQGRKAEAVHEAKLALDAARQTGSGFRYHPDLGLVENTADDFGNRLKRLVRTSHWWRSFLP